MQTKRVNIFFIEFTETAIGEKLIHPFVMPYSETNLETLLGSQTFYPKNEILYTS